MKKYKTIFDNSKNKDPDSTISQISKDIEERWKQISDITGVPKSVMEKAVEKEIPKEPWYKKWWNKITGKKKPEEIIPGPTSSNLANKYFNASIASYVSSFAGNISTVQPMSKPQGLSSYFSPISVTFAIGDYYWSSYEVRFWVVMVGDKPIGMYSRWQDVVKFQVENPAVSNFEIVFRPSNRKKALKLKRKLYLAYYDSEDLGRSWFNSYLLYETYDEAITKSSNVNHVKGEEKKYPIVLEGKFNGNGYCWIFTQVDAQKVKDDVDACDLPF